MTEGIADEHAGELPKNDEDRERIYEASIIRLGFKKLFKILDAMPPVGESIKPSDLLDEITAEQSPPEMQKEDKNHE